LAGNDTPILLIAGLGNPGPEYQATRHNAGFWFLDALAERVNCALRAESKFRSEIGRARIDGRECWLQKPMAFMNLSGDAVLSLAGFYKIPPESILVVHDELDLPPGRVQLKRGGGHGGHNGLRDLTAKLGSDFMRLRLGIGHPGHRDQVTDYVLGKPSGADRDLIVSAIDAAMEVLPLVVAGEMEKAMHRLHS
jgi:PTH1 family peptidyl-tRNA hydrolase